MFLKKKNKPFTFFFLYLKNSNFSWAHSKSSVLNKHLTLTKRREKEVVDREAATLRNV
jgi:hypothetical protein